MAHLRLLPSLLLASLPLVGLTACGSDDPGPEKAVNVDAGTGAEAAKSDDLAGENGAGTETAAEDVQLVEIPTVRYAWDPQAGDESVPASMGGPGFTGEGWTTNMEFPALGSAKAIKGGTMRRYLPDWPATLRQHGKDWNSSLNYTVNSLCYESLLQVHPTTLEYIPMLATHWKISEDKSTYTYRINPKARWSDGSEVTADDVVASWKLRMDPKCLDPSSIGTYGKLDEPKALSKYIVEVRCNTPNWRNFLYFSGMSVFPAAEISIPGDEYLDKYQNAYTANSGPYMVHPEDVQLGTSIDVRRRKDWWDIENPAWIGVSNIDTYHYEVVMDPQLAYEKIKKGELDYMLVPRAQWWAEEIPEFDSVKRGLLVPCKYYTDAPVGTSGIAINTQRAPLDDVRMREVLQLLYNRPVFIEKLYFNEYEPLTSYYQGGTYQNPNNKLYEYDPFRAVELLEEMGWTEIDSDGYRIKDGKRLGFKLTYASKFSESSLTIYQEDCKAAGIKIDLSLETPATRWKNMRSKKFDLTSTAWGALTFPNPETSFLSDYAKQVDNNNVTSFADPRVDELCHEYDAEYDVKRRVEIIREIDGIIYQAKPYVLGWYNPAQRLLYWNKFSQPEWGGTKTADYDALPFTWWVDPEKEAQLKAAMADPAATMPLSPRENRFWKIWDAQR